MNLFGHHLEGMAERLLNKQIDAWWNITPTLLYATEKMLQAFKTRIILAQVMDLFTRPKTQ